jgi:hypothetical protein
LEFYFFLPFHFHHLENDPPHLLISKELTMRKAQLSLVLIVFFSFAGAQSITPTVINSSGGSAVINVQNLPFHLDWNVGEMTLVNTITGSGPKLLIITNGFLQPEYSGDHGQEGEKPGADLFTRSQITVFPNPTSEYVDVTLFFDQPGTVRLNLFNIMGEKLFSRETLLNTKTSSEHIPMAKYTPGTYLLHVQLVSQGKIIKQGSYKIVKTN